MVPRLCLGAFKLSQPLLINRITSLLSESTTDWSLNAGRGIIGATVIVYLGLAISGALYKRQLHRLLTKIRGTIVTAVHSKTLELSSDKLSDNAALSLITADVNRITFSLEKFDELFAASLEIGVAVFLLQRQIAISSIASVALVVVVSVTSFFNSNTAVPMQKAWLASVQERVAYTAAVLGSPKGFKMLGLTNHLSDRIQALRVKELAEFARFRKYVTYRNGFSFIPQDFAPCVALMALTLINGGSALNPTVAFTTLSLVALLTDPMQNLIHAVPTFQTTLASLDRIQAFLILKSDVAHDVQSREIQESLHPNQDDSVEMNDRSVHRASSGIDRDLAFRIESGTARVGEERKLVLENINIALNFGTLNLIVGPVGAGKSTLLKVIVGEFAIEKGARISNYIPDDYAYCAHDPWLPNDTVRNLILGPSELDSTWYSTVVHACALHTDTSTFPMGDDTIIGTRGVSLSGGQRQRLALARALYSRKKLLVIDDSLSGLDAHTSRAVFERVLGTQGLCKSFGMTVVFATHSLQYLRAADHIIALGEGGNIVEQGTFHQLNERAGYVHELNLKGSRGTASESEEEQKLSKPVPASDKVEAAQQDLARRTGDMAVYRYYAKSIGWWYSSIIVLTAVGWAFGVIFPNVWVRWWSESRSWIESTTSTWPVDRSLPSLWLDWCRVRFRTYLGHAGQLCSEELCATAQATTYNRNESALLILRGYGLRCHTQSVLD